LHPSHLRFVGTPAARAAGGSLLRGLLPARLRHKGRSLSELTGLAGGGDGSKHSGGGGLSRKASDDSLPLMQRSR
jgi:hypothetical protein